MPEETNESNESNVIEEAVVNGPPTIRTYYIDDAMRERIENNFLYHPPGGDQPARYVFLRNAFRELAFLVAQHTPQSREQSIALTALEEAGMWTNAAIARNE